MTPSAGAKALRGAIGARTPKAFMAAPWKVREHFPAKPFSRRPVVLRVIWLVTDVGAAYLAQAVRLFPKGVVEPMPVDRMWQMDAILEKSPEAFERIDRKYRGWTTNLRLPLQRHLRANEKQIQRMLVRVVRPPRRPKLSDVTAIVGMDDPWEALDELLATMWK